MKGKKAKAVKKVSLTDKKVSPPAMKVAIQQTVTEPPVRSFVENTMKGVFPKIEKQITKLRQSIEDHNEELGAKKEKLNELRESLETMRNVRDSIPSISNLVVCNFLCTSLDHSYSKTEKQITKLEKSIEDHNKELEKKIEKLSTLQNDLNHLMYIRSNIPSIHI